MLTVANSKDDIAWDREDVSDSTSHDSGQCTSVE